MVLTGSQYVIAACPGRIGFYSFGKAASDDKVACQQFGFRQSDEVEIVVPVAERDVAGTGAVIDRTRQNILARGVLAAIGRNVKLFAGSLAKAMWGIGKALLAFAAGAAGAWYSMTGRPPP